MFEVIFRFTCSACQTQKEEHYSLAPYNLHPYTYSTRPAPTLPEGWKIVGTQLFCEKEKVHVKVTNGDTVLLDEPDYRWRMV